MSAKTGRTGLAFTTSLGLGLALYAAASFLMWDAFEARGNSRPFVMRFVGGLI